MGQRVLVALLALHAAALYLFTTGFFLTRFEVSDLSSCQFVADPPTMTMQRLKGLTTGSLPTFLDIKDNMAASSHIVEDNLLRQLRAQQRGVIFMGDDTWESLYAREFTRKFAFDSFNVKDLHSVDRGVTAHLFPELQKPDWDLLIAHFLGTLKDMPDGDDVLLAVLGDHGMSADGNHGGASDEETGAALFLYSKGSLVATGEEGDDEGNELRKFAEKIRKSSQEVPQILIRL
eukprot:jgi/Phyca11/16294/fgenesh1_pg.PHYCAscaffold_19_\